MTRSGTFDIFIEVSNPRARAMQRMVKVPRGSLRSRLDISLAWSYGSKLIGAVWYSAGQPRRHLLTTGWSVFVSAKRLQAGDSVLFIRCLLFFDITSTI